VSKLESEAGVNSQLTNNFELELKLLEFEFYEINSNFLKMVPDDQTTG
jgi:hypothetical protein